MCTFTGGELQRFAIAVVAAQQADIYMIDEPSSYLDVRQRLKAAKVCGALHAPFHSHSCHHMGCLPGLMQTSSRCRPATGSSSTNCYPQGAESGFDSGQVQNHGKCPAMGQCMHCCIPAQSMAAFTHIVGNFQVHYVVTEPSS